MKEVFADTSFFVAFVNHRDAWHDLAMQVGDQLEGPLVTTDFVIVEFGNALCASSDRHLFLQFVEFMKNTPQFEIVAASRDLLEKGLALFADRQDKNWSVTDCISMVVMEERGLTKALTADHHFEQAGYQVLLRH